MTVPSSTSQPPQQQIIYGVLEYLVAYCIETGRDKSVEFPYDSFGPIVAGKNGELDKEVFRALRYLKSKHIVGDIESSGRSADVLELSWINVPLMEDEFEKYRAQRSNVVQLAMAEKRVNSRPTPRIIGNRIIYNGRSSVALTKGQAGILSELIDAARITIDGQEVQAGSPCSLSELMRASGSQSTAACRRTIGRINTGVFNGNNLPFRVTNQRHTGEYLLNLNLSTRHKQD